MYIYMFISMEGVPEFVCHIRNNDISVQRMVYISRACIFTIMR